MELWLSNLLHEMLLAHLEMACQSFLPVTELWAVWPAASGLCPFVLSICQGRGRGWIHWISPRGRKTSWVGFKLKGKNIYVPRSQYTHKHRHRHTDTHRHTHNATLWTNMWTVPSTWAHWTSLPAAAEGFSIYSSLSCDLHQDFPHYCLLLRPLSFLIFKN